MATDEHAGRNGQELPTTDALAAENALLRQRIAELEATGTPCTTRKEFAERMTGECGPAAPECHLQEMANNVHDVFWVFDWVAQKVIYVSPAYEEIWGRPVQALYERHDEWGESVHPDDREFASASFAKAVETGGGEPREYRIVRLDGTIRWVSNRAYAIRDPGGNVCRVAGVAKDITDQKQTEEALRESQARLRAAVESLPFDFFMLDSDGRYVMANSVAREHWGEQVGRRPEDVCLDEATLALWRSNNQRAFAGEVVKGEVEMAPGGQSGCYYNIISPVRDGDAIRGILGVNIDITAQKQAEAALRESEEKFRNLAEQSPSMIFINRGGRIVYVNQRSEECMGVSREEFCSPEFDFMTLIAPEYHDLIRNNLRRHLNGEEVPEVEYAVITRDGRRIESLLATKLTRYQGDLAILGVVTDITAIKRAEADLRRAKAELEQRVRERTAELEAEVDRRMQVETELRESEEKYRVVVENAGYAVAIVTEGGRILFVNSTVAGHFGVTAGVMVGKTMHEFFPEAFADLQVKRVREVLSTGKGNNLLATAPIPGGERWFNTTFEPLHVGGTNAALIIARDVDDLVQARKQLEDYREQMTRADRLASLGTMSAMVAHELTQPLTVMRLSIQNALEAIKTGAASSAVVEDIEGCVEEVATMTGIVERFRGFARASSPGQRFDVDLSTIAGHMVGLTAEAAERARVSVSLQGLDGLPTFSARAKDMEQVFFALLMNSIQAADGTTDRTVVVRGQARDREIELSFEDDCGGIAAEHVDRIFKPFFTTKGKAGGTGLGLCVVEHILDRYGAKIRVANRPGEGATFRITLPLAREG